ncbi:MAG: hypothetical protein JWM68_4802 [Verrucomicrobiales bacterium]|nr:hypothetical protein [Verrucomicrobiales bacterium]
MSTPENTPANPTVTTPGTVSGTASGTTPVITPVITAGSAPGNPDGTTWENRDTEKIISDIRAEVSSQKESITRYTFQAVGAAGVIWGLVLKLDGKAIPLYDGAAVYLCGTVVVFLMLVVVRITNHNYHTVNRNSGYELHLCRLKDYSRVVHEKNKSGRRELADRMLKVGWEEAMCAWRFVQPSLFSHVYKSFKNQFASVFFAHKIKKKLYPLPLYRWYATETLVKGDAVYHPGSYLRNIHWILYTVGGLSLAMMWVFLFVQAKALPGISIGQLVFSDFINVIITGWFFAQFNRQSSFRKLLEKEMLSIQSCAVVWRVVITCHLLGSTWAIKTNKSYKSYTTYTSGLALDFNEQFDNPHAWLTDWEDIFGTPAMDERLRKLFPESSTTTTKPDGKS